MIWQIFLLAFLRVRIFSMSHSVTFTIIYMYLLLRCLPKSLTESHALYRSIIRKIKQQSTKN